MSNRKWYLGLLLLLIVFVLLMLQFLLSTLRIRELVKPPEAGRAGGEALRHAVLISQELDNPYWRAIEKGAREAAEQYGWELEYAGSFRINPAEQLQLLEKAIAAKADALLVQGVGSAQYRQLIDKAVGQGIPVITVDTDEPGSRRLSYVGTDNRSAGQRMGELIVQRAGSSGVIGVLIGSETESQLQRLEGFRSVIGRYPELSIAEVRISNISRLQAAQQAADMLADHPQMQAMVGFSALDGPGMLEAAGRLNRHNLLLFAFDDLDTTVEGIRQCKVAASIVQQPYKMGYDAVTLLQQHASGQPPESRHFTDTAVLDHKTAGGEPKGDCP